MKTITNIRSVFRPNNDKKYHLLQHLGVQIEPTTISSEDTGGSGCKQIYQPSSNLPQRTEKRLLIKKSDHEAAETCHPVSLAFIICQVIDRIRRKA